MINLGQKIKSFIEIFNASLKTVLITFSVASVVWAVVVFGFLPIKGCNDKPPENTDFNQIDDHTGQSGVTYGNNGEGTNNTATYGIGNQGNTSCNVQSNSVGDKYYEFFMEENGPPMGYIKVSKDGKVQGKIYLADINVNTKISPENKTQYRIINTADLTVKEVGQFPNANKEWVDKPYPLDIKNAQALVNMSKTEKGKIVFAFYPDLGINGVYIPNKVAGDVRPNIGFSLINWDKGDFTSLKFLRVGVGASIKYKVADFSISPIMYNLGNGIKCIKNTYVGPVLGFSTDKNVNLGGALVLGF